MDSSGEGHSRGFLAWPVFAFRIFFPLNPNSLKDLVKSLSEAELKLFTSCKKKKSAIYI